MGHADRLSCGPLGREAGYFSRCRNTAMSKLESREDLQGLESVPYLLLDLLSTMHGAAAGFRRV